ncbi:MAG: DUF368 domain-containing protein [Planctomycetota bacterium]
MSSEKDSEDPAETPGGAAWPEVPGLVARGLCMGSADVVPGVSGGTMALILGIYVRLVAAIRTIDAAALRHVLRGRFAAARDHVAWRFLGAVACGQALGIVTFTAVIPLPRLIQEHPELVYGLFFGLVLGTILALGRDVIAGPPAGEAPPRGPNGGAACAVAGVLGVAFGLFIVTAVPVSTPETPLFVFACGAISICAMILPGISGSFVLLLLRKYAFVLGALGEVLRGDGPHGRIRPLVEVVVPFAFGCLLGLLAFSRFLHWLLRRAERATLAFMTGLLIGSLYAIWPFAERTYEVVRDKPRMIGWRPHLPALDGTAAASLVLALAGFVGVVAMERLARRRPETAAA